MSSSSSTAKRAADQPRSSDTPDAETPETEMVQRAPRYINRVPRPACASAEALTALELKLAQIVAVNAEMPWYAPAGLPDLGTLYLARTPVHVAALHDAGLSAACPSGGLDIGTAAVAALKAHPRCAIVMLADLCDDGLRAALMGADRLRSSGITAEVRTWPAETPDRFSVLDEYVFAAGNHATLERALDQLPAVDLPPRPPGGFWWPTGEPFRWPDRYVMGPHGVCRLVEDRKTREITLKPITVMPVWVGKRYQGADNSDSAIQLCACLDGRTIRRVVAMSEISTASKLPALTDHGYLGFHSENAGEVVSYLTYAIAANLERLPRAQTARAMGFEFAPQSNTPRAFVHGGVRLLPNGTREQVELSPSSGVQPRRWELYRTKGDPVAWGGLITVYREHGFDVPMTLLLAGVASLLNRPLGVMPMSLQVAGESASGKSTTAQHVMSLQGDPTDLSSMRATDNAMEMKLRFNNDLPLLMDEVQSYCPGHRQDQALEALVYMVSEREGKDRLRRDGSERTTSAWSCNMICTGEKDLGDLGASGNTGVRRRVLTFFGTPFGERSPRIGAVLRQLADLIADHYGHAIPMVAAHLLGYSDDQWSALRKRHRAIVVRYLEHQTPKGIDAGLAETAARAFATFEIAGDLLKLVFPTAFGTADGTPDGFPTIEQMLAGPWSQTLLRMGVALRADRSIEALRTFFATRRGDFEGGCIPAPAVSTGRPAGRVGVYNDIPYVAFVPEVLSAFLSENGFDYATDRKHWDERGWVLSDAAGKRTVSVRINGAKVRCLCIRQSALDILEETSGDSPNTCAEQPEQPPVASEDDGFPF